MLKRAKLMEPAAEIVIPNHRSNPRLLAAREQATRLDREIEDAVEIRNRKRSQVHQSDRALKELVSKAVLATEPISQEDVDRLTRHRAQVEREFAAAEEIVTQKRAVRDGLRAAVEQLEANLQAETRSAVKVAILPLAQRQIQLLREAAALNLRITTLADQATHIDPLHVNYPGLELTPGSGALFFYLRGLEEFVASQIDTAA